jgi:hypothetical protein
MLWHCLSLSYLHDLYCVTIYHWTTLPVLSNIVEIHSPHPIFQFWCTSIYIFVYNFSPFLFFFQYVDTDGFYDNPFWYRLLYMVPMFMIFRTRLYIAWLVSECMCMTSTLGAYPVGSWIYNYLCNQCLSPLMLWVRIPLRARCTTLCDKVCQWLVAGQWNWRWTP